MEHMWTLETLLNDILADALISLDTLWIQSDVQQAQSSLGNRYLAQEHSSHSCWPRELNQ